MTPDELADRLVEVRHHPAQHAARPFLVRVAGGAVGEWANASGAEGIADRWRADLARALTRLVARYGPCWQPAPGGDPEPTLMPKARELVADWAGTAPTAQRLTSAMDLADCAAWLLTYADEQRGRCEAAEAAVADLTGPDAPAAYRRGYDDALKAVLGLLKRVREEALGDAREARRKGQDDAADALEDDAAVLADLVPLVRALGEGVS